MEPIRALDRGHRGGAAAQRTCTQAETGEDSSELMTVSDADHCKEDEEDRNQEKCFELGDG